MRSYFCVSQGDGPKSMSILLIGRMASIHFIQEHSLNGAGPTYCIFSVKGKAKATDMHGTRHKAEVSTNKITSTTSKSIISSSSHVGFHSADIHHRGLTDRFSTCRSTSTLTTDETSARQHPRCTRPYPIKGHHEFIHQIGRAHV